MRTKRDGRTALHNDAVNCYFAFFEKNLLSLLGGGGGGI